MLGSSIEEDFSVFLKETVSKAKNKKSLWFCYVIILNWYIFLFVFSFYFGPRFYFKHEYCMDSFNFLLLRTAGNTLVLFLLCTQLSARTTAVELQPRLTSSIMVGYTLLKGMLDF